jgi:8-oxo-dGTP pyrophosphatase MutT (NUDIX family)
MPHRDLLLEQLRRYRARHPDQRERAEFVREFVTRHEDCFERACREGHVTGSAWILSPDHRRVLLTHHRKLGRWLQLGGHADGDPDPFRVALREACEESGMARFQSLPAGMDPPPLDVDVHRIPHLDVRFLLVAEPGQSLAVSEESHDLRWVDRDRLRQWIDDESQLRMERHARLRFAG